MPFTELPDIPITPIPRGRGVGAFSRKLPFKVPCASTPISCIHRKVAKDGELEKGKATLVLRQQNEAPTAAPLKSQYQSEFEKHVRSKLYGNKKLGVTPVVSEVKMLGEGAETKESAVKKQAGIQKTVTSKVDAQRKLGEEVKTRAPPVSEGKDEGKEKGHLRLRAGGYKPQGNIVKVASKLKKEAEKSEKKDENVPMLAKNNQKADNCTGQLSESTDSLNTLQRKNSESVHKITKKHSQPTSSKQSRTGSNKETIGELLTSQATGSKELLSNYANSEAGAAKVSYNSDAKTTEADSATTKQIAKTKSLARTLNSRSSETKENKLNIRHLKKCKSVVSQTIGSTNVIKTRATKVSDRVNNDSRAEKKLGSVPTDSEVQNPRVKSSAKINSQGTTSLVSAYQSEHPKGLTSNIADSVFANSNATGSKSKDAKASAGSVKHTSVKPRAKKHVASEEVFNYLEDSTEAGHATDRTGPISKPKRRKIVAEGSDEESSTASTQPGKRFLKHKTLKPQKLLPNSSQEKALNQAQHLNRRKSDELRDIELKVKPKAYQHWKTVSRATIEFTMGTLLQSFDEKFSSHEADLINLVKCFEELKSRMTSELNFVRVPSSRQPVNYLTLTKQKASLETHLDESLLDVEQINAVIASCKESNEKLKILKERLQSKRITTSETELRYDTSFQKSRSTVGSRSTLEEASSSEVQEE